MNKLEEGLSKGDSSLYEQYEGLSEKLEPIHNSVVAGAAMRDGGWLTDHGPAHIEKVAHMAAEIVSQMEEELLPYEIFLLLLAIQVHDIGNVKGRENHENRIDEVWRTVFGPLGFDSLDKTMAIQIASTHGGKYQGSKSTLQAVLRETKYKGFIIRPRMLAAILKLADELAEEVDRASLPQMELGSLPKESEIFHVYSSGLHTTHLESESATIELGFSFSNKLFGRKLGKGKKQEYLLNEIYSRTVKTWSEAIYCSRYLPKILITTVDVEIQIFDDESSLEVERIKYRLEDSGYPTIASGNIFEVCPELSNFRGKGQLTPELLADTLNQNREDIVVSSEALDAPRSGGFIVTAKQMLRGLFK